jgi:GST-like protein
LERTTMMKFLYNNAPNPMKVALLLEELGGPYEAVPIDTRRGERVQTPPGLAQASK